MIVIDHNSKTPVYEQIKVLNHRLSDLEHGEVKG